MGTDLGILTVPEDVTSGDTVETHLGEKFTVQELRGPDLFDHLKRTGAPMMPRDIGLVIGHTGACADDRILDAGTGSGILAVCLGRVGATVVSYEIDEEFASVARDNAITAGVSDSVTVRSRDVTDAFDELIEQDPFDVITLDTADAPKVAGQADELLVSGGFIAIYSPFVEGSRDAVEAARTAGLEQIRTLETIQREMDIGDRGSRPSTAGVGHTGYLTFARAP